MTSHGRSSSGGRQQRAEHADGGGLAGAVGPQEPIDLALANVEVEAVDGGHTVEAAHQTLGGDRGRVVVDHDSIFRAETGHLMAGFLVVLMRSETTGPARTHR